MTYYNFIDIIVGEIYSDYRKIVGRSCQRRDIIDNIAYISEAGNARTAMVRFMDCVYIFTYDVTMENQNLKVEVYRRIK